MRLSHVPLRLVTGAFILNSGMGKRGIDADSAAGMQGMAASVVPQAGKMPPEQFGRLLSTGEMALGALLLAPFVSPVVAGAGLTAFSGGLLQMYRKAPGMTEEDGIRPTQAGTSFAKDVWMFGIGTALVLDGLIDGTRSAARSTRKSVSSTARKTRKSAAKAKKEAGKNAGRSAGKAGRSAAKARKDARRSASRARRSLPV